MLAFENAAASVDAPMSAGFEACTMTVLESEADREAFFNALDNPPEPTERLRKAFAHRKKLIANSD